MKKTFLLLISTFAVCTSCLHTRQLATITVENSLSTERQGEMAEVPLRALPAKVAKAGTFVITGPDGKSVPYQITHDSLLIFPIRVLPFAQTTYTLRKGEYAGTDTVACGRTYPQRMDDLAWENDKVAFRAYGPTLQQRKERAFGYDIFTKRGTSRPVLEGMYEKETNPENWKKIRALQKTDPKAAARLQFEISYHTDKGYGMDCYAVGPTLGAGTAALLHDGQIVYPWCYRTCRLLDNGPLRFTAELEFTPLQAGSVDGIVERRLITLDAGSQFNRTEITYRGLDHPSPLVVGIVMHQPNRELTTHTADGYITYPDPTTGKKNGEIYIGAVIPGKVTQTGPEFFSPEESKQRANALGHVLAHSEYQPGTPFVYYWGYGWSKAGFASYSDWNRHVSQFARQVRHPLHILINGKEMKR